MTKDIGNLCIYCFKDTSFGSGRFVNRIPACDDEHDGYACPECMEMECDRCDKMIGLDCDVTWNGMKLHEECLTPAEHEEYIQEYENDMGDGSSTSHNPNPEGG
jgi:hypothetical protein